ncbi:MAG TPA: PilZ domain-containing protein [Polyangiaceae bacterium]
MNHPSPVPAPVSDRSQAPASHLARPSDGHAVFAERPSLERRRLGERTPVVLDATVFRGADLRLTRTLDLSSTGCALEACADPLAGQVTLQLVSGSGEVLRVAARFRRSYQGADAYEFVDLDDTDRLTIAEIIDTFRGPAH